MRTYEVGAQAGGRGGWLHNHQPPGKTAPAAHGKWGVDFTLHHALPLGFLSLLSAVIRQ